MKRSHSIRRKFSLLLALAMLVSAAGLPAGLAGASAQSDKSDKAKKKEKSFGHKPEPNSISPPGRGRSLTAPSKGRPFDIAVAFLKQNRQKFGLGEADLVEFKVTDQYTSEHNGVTHIYLRQEIGGIEVVGADVGTNVARDGTVINLHSSFIRGVDAAANRRAPVLSAVQAVEAAARHLGLALTEPLQVLEAQGGPQQRTTFSTGGVSLDPIRVKLVYQPTADDAVRLAWSVEISELSGEHAWNLRLDAETSEALAGDDMVDSDNWGADFAPDMERNRKLAARAASFGPARAASLSPAPAATVNDGSAYNVFAFPLESPNDGGRTLVSNPADSLASPFGWHDTNGAAGPEFTRTRGNNVHAYTDVDANGVPDANSDPDGGPGLQFDFPFNHDTMHPADYRPAAVTNLFYWNNIVHDVFYQYGFNEMSGNFQINHYGRGPAVAPFGTGDDVRAEAQDGSGTNNANFNTNVDGVRPRMQMFVWNYPFSRAVVVNSPAAAAGTYPAAVANFGPPANGLSGDVALANDGDGSTSDACQPLVGFPAGQIALLDRGSCDFVVKVKNAQNAGAVGVIVANNADTDPVTMGGTDATITIPAIMVYQAAGNLFKANLPINVSIGLHPSPPPNRDSDFDAGVIAHEYGHGISNRLTGGRNVVGCLNNTEQMGEGWSDFAGLVVTTDPSDTAATARGIGTYVSFQSGVTGRGIRPTPYTTNMAVNPSTYDTIKTAAVPHGIGYVWATMLWEMYWNLVEVHGYNPNVYDHWTTGGNNLAVQLVVDGMKLQPCSPGFVTGRNAIIAADVALTGGENECLIWEAFAKRGLGYSAAQGSSNNRSDGTQAFDLPPACRAQIGVVPPSLSQTLEPNTQATQDLTVSNDAKEHGADLGWTITEAASDCNAPSDVAWLSASPAAGTTAAAATSSVTVAFDSTGQSIGQHTAKLCFASTGGNQEIPVTLNVIYDFAGFFGQVLNPPAFNDPNSGSTVPLKFSLGGDYGLDIFASGYPASRQVDCATKLPTGPLQPTETPGSSGLTYDPVTGGYQYNWKTSKAWQGTCRELVVVLDDGTTHNAYFNFKK